METKSINFSVASTAARWWVVIEPIAEEFDSPGTAKTLNLEEGVKYAVVYYVQGSPGDKFKLSGRQGKQDVFDAIDREISAKGFGYGHKSFTL